MSPSVALTRFKSALSKLSGDSPTPPVQATLLVFDSLTEESLGQLVCQFNPQELSITKRVSWVPEQVRDMNSPDLELMGGEPAQFGLSLIFDTTNETDPAEQDVRKYTNVLLGLTMLGGDTEWGREPPPMVRFVWGDMVLFTAVVQEVAITYTLFLPSGTPVRARANVSFIQLDLEDDIEQPTNPTTRTEARKTHRVQQGERIDLIAYQEYGHPSYWRYLAEANDLLDPLDLRPGQILRIPPLP